MRFDQVPIGNVFFDAGTGEYHMKLDEGTSVVIDRDSGDEYYQCEFPPWHEVEEPDD